MDQNPYESPRATPIAKSRFGKLPGELYPGLYFGVLIQAVGLLLMLASGLGAFSTDWNIPIGLTAMAMAMIPGGICMFVMRYRRVQAVADKNSA